MTCQNLCCEKGLLGITKDVFILLGFKGQFLSHIIKIPLLLFFFAE